MFVSLYGHSQVMACTVFYSVLNHIPPASTKNRHLEWQRNQSEKLQTSDQEAGKSKSKILVLI
jgi:hypothetical protein